MGSVPRWFKLRIADEMLKFQRFIPVAYHMKEFISYFIALHSSVYYIEKEARISLSSSGLARAAQIKNGLNSRIVCDAFQKSQGTLSRLTATVRKDQKLENLAFSLVNSYS